MLLYAPAYLADREQLQDLKPRRRRNPQSRMMLLLAQSRFPRPIHLAFSRLGTSDLQWAG